MPPELPDRILNATDLMIIIGGKGELSTAQAQEMAGHVKLVATANSTAPITLSIGGYDNDPRDLWEIPEVAVYIVQFARRLHALGLPPNFFARLTPESLRWQRSD